MYKSANDDIPILSLGQKAVRRRNSRPKKIVNNNALGVYLACTRFNMTTWKENMSYRMKRKISVVYGTDMRIRTNYPMLTRWLIVEMNNDLNLIMGVGLVTNRLSFGHQIYLNQNYNRYVYMGDLWASRSTLVSRCPQLIIQLEKILFMGKSHVKRQTGISLIPKKLMLEKELCETDVVCELVNCITCARPCSCV